MTTVLSAKNVENNPSTQQQQQQPAVLSSSTSTKDFSLPVSHLTSTSIFVPEISLMMMIQTTSNQQQFGTPNKTFTNTIACATTLLNSLPSEETPDQSLANVVGATSAAGGGLMIHIFRFCFSQQDLDSANNNFSLLPPLVVLLDEEEASNRGAGGVVSPLRLEKRVNSIRKNVKSLRFLPDEYDRFFHSATLFRQNSGDFDTVKNLVDSALVGNNNNNMNEKFLGMVAGVLVDKLPKLRIQKYEEGSSFVKVIVR
jgi:hypothetical protein